MPQKSPPSAPLALTADGGVLLNLSGRLDAATLARVALALGVKPGDLFIGTRLPAARRTQVLARMDDAGAEAAARILGEAGSSLPGGRAKKRAR